MQIDDNLLGRLLTLKSNLKVIFKWCDKRTRNAREKQAFQLLFMCVFVMVPQAL
jgi:hypothetical protein